MRTAMRIIGGALFLVAVAVIVGVASTIGEMVLLYVLVAALAVIAVSLWEAHRLDR